MTEQAKSKGWVWQTVATVGMVTEHSLEGPDVLCRYWGGKPPSEHALLIAAAPETAVERDRLKAINTELIEAAKKLLEIRAMSASQLDSTFGPFAEFAELRVVERLVNAMEGIT